MLTKISSYRRYVCVIGIFYSTLSSAANWGVDGSLSQATGYDDNFRFSKVPVGAFEYFLTPSLNFKRKDDDWDISGSGSYGLRQYSYSIYNNTPQNYSINADYKLAKMVWGLNASYSEVLTNSVASLDTGNFTTSSSRVTETISPHVSYELNSQDTLNLSGTYTQTAYSSGHIARIDNQPASVTTLFNNSNESATLGWKRNLTDRLSQNLSGTYSRSLFNTTVNLLSDTYSANYGLTYELDPQWKINGTIGERITEQSYQGGVLHGSRSSNSSGWTANLGMNHQGKQSSESLSFARMVSPSGQGVLTQQSVVNADYNYKYSERWSADINGSYIMTDTVGVSNLPTNTSNRTFYTIQPSINWRMTPDINVKLVFMYRQQEYLYTASSKSLMLTFNYNWSGLNISR